MNLEQYQKFTAETRERRIAWWRDARFGMFIHYGIYSCYGRGEWIRMREGISREEYLNTANTQFNYKSGNAEEWVKLAVTSLTSPCLKWTSATRSRYITSSPRI